MPLAWGDLESFPGLKNKVVMLDFEGQLSFKDVEKLAGVDVGVTGFAGAGRHEFFDDVEFGRADKVPAVAVVAPGIVLGVSGGDGFGRHRFSKRRFYPLSNAYPCGLWVSGN
jgi:hypothetical protein